MLISTECKLSCWVVRLKWTLQGAGKAACAVDWHDTPHRPAAPPPLEHQNRRRHFATANLAPSRLGVTNSNAEASTVVLRCNRQGLGNAREASGPGKARARKPPPAPLHSSTPCAVRHQFPCPAPRRRVASCTVAYGGSWTARRCDRVDDTLAERAREMLARHRTMHAVSLTCIQPGRFSRQVCARRLPTRGDHRRLTSRVSQRLVCGVSAAEALVSPAEVALPDDFMQVCSILNRKHDNPLICLPYM